MKPKKVLLAFDSPYYKERGYDFKKEFEELDWSAENEVYQALLANKYQVSLLGVCNDIGIILEEIKENKPDIIFNMVEVFNNVSCLDKNVVALFEMLGIPYTGASSESLFVCGDKGLTKKILSFHRIKVPNFYVFYRGHKVWHPKKMELPIIVKPLLEEASRGISESSIVDDEKSLKERVKFIHESLNLDVICEEYIEGREFYVSVMGIRKLTVFPIREMKFGSIPEDEPRIATYKAKWDYDYRQKWGIKNVFAGRLPDGIEEKIIQTCKRAYRALNIRSYARFDIRLDNKGRVYILEANANPSLDRYDEIALSAEKIGITYPQLIKKIVNLGFKRCLCR